MPRHRPARFAEGGFVPPPILVDAVPYPGLDPPTFRPERDEPKHLVRGGDEIDLGDRRLVVVELPGHTPGSIGLVDHEERGLLSGDAIYDGGLIDTLPESAVEAHLGTMELLRRFDVDVVYPGHGWPSRESGRASSPGNTCAKRAVEPDRPTPTRSRRG